MNHETAMYDHATAVSRGLRVQRLEALLHAILRRHHPNGCEIAMIELAALERCDGLSLRFTENPQRATVIVSSPWSEVRR